MQTCQRRRCHLAQPDGVHLVYDFCGACPHKKDIAGAELDFLMRCAGFKILHCDAVSVEWVKVQAFLFSVCGVVDVGMVLDSVESTDKASLSGFAPLDTILDFEGGIANNFWSKEVKSSDLVFLSVLVKDTPGTAFWHTFNLRKTIEEEIWGLELRGDIVVNLEFIPGLLQPGCDLSCFGIDPYYNLSSSKSKHSHTILPRRLSNLINTDTLQPRHDQRNPLHRAALIPLFDHALTIPLIPLLRRRQRPRVPAVSLDHLGRALQLAPRRIRLELQRVEGDLGYHL
ncbi:hypothetical protein HG530_014289 [Fusarium avenaceum]|nr:hypothetical protein HG530_014289 [Fusarium avenaceum]